MKTKSTRSGLSRVISGILVSGVVAMGLVAAGPDRAEAATTTCLLTQNYPHPSVHVGGTINVTSSIKCDKSAAEIYMKVTLRKSGGGSWPSSLKGRLGVNYLKHNSATNCSAGPGSFRNVTYYQVVAPPNVGGSKTSSVYGPWRSVACGVAMKSPEPVIVEL